MFNKLFRCLTLPSPKERVYNTVIYYLKAFKVLSLGEDSGEAKFYCSG